MNHAQKIKAVHDASEWLKGSGHLASYNVGVVAKDLAWVACHLDGHLDLPRPRKRWMGLTWRCDRCGQTLTVVERSSYTTEGYGREWKELADA